MEIRFSESFVGEPALKPAALWHVVKAEARKYVSGLDMGNARARSVRFTIPAGTELDHDIVIRALLTLDPDATVRTSRAVYEGLASFEAQVKARVP